MTTLRNTKGTKAVNISTDNGYDTPIFRAMYVQIYKGQEQVLESKSFSTEKRAITWANKTLA